MPRQSKISETLISIAILVLFAVKIQRLLPLFFVTIFFGFYIYQKKIPLDGAQVYFEAINRIIACHSLAVLASFSTTVSCVKSRVLGQDF